MSASLAAGTAHAQTTAVPANDFLNSLGICTQVHQGNSTSQLINLLSYTGIRQIREDQVSAVISMHNATGVKACLIMPANGDAWMPAFLQRARDMANAGALLAIEGPNEANNWPVTYGGQTSNYNTTFLPLANYQKAIYAAVKADPILSSYPVFGASEGGGAQPNNVGLQWNTIPAGAGVLMPDGTKYADYANCHNYVCKTSTIVDNNAWKAAADGASEGPYDGMYAEYGRTWHGLFYGYTLAQLPTVPKVCTETGWQTGSAAPYVTEAQQGKLYLNIFLAQFKRGWKYTFIYKMVDLGDTYGIYRSNYTPKLAADYIHNFTTILADTGSITPGVLNYSIPSKPVTVHDLLLQKSNGTFELAVWNERASGSDSVTVNLGGTYPTVKVYDPTIGTTAIQTLTNASSVALNLSDHPVIIEIPGTVLPSGTYKIVNQSTGKSLRPLGASLAEDANIVQYTYDSTWTSERWTVTNLGTGYYKIINVYTGKSLRPVNGFSGANIVQHTYDSTYLSEQWQVTSVGGGYYSIVNRYSGMGFKPLGTANDSQIVQQTYNSADSSMKWLIAAP